MSSSATITLKRYRVPGRKAAATLPMASDTTGYTTPPMMIARNWLGAMPPAEAGNNTRIGDSPGLDGSPATRRVSHLPARRFQLTASGYLSRVIIPGPLVTRNGVFHLLGLGGRYWFHPFQRNSHPTRIAAISDMVIFC